MNNFSFGIGVIISGKPRWGASGFLPNPLIDQKYSNLLLVCPIPTWYKTYKTDMIGSEQVEQLRTLVDQAQSVFVIVGESATVDHVAVAIALQRAFQAAGKDALLIAPTKLTHPQLQTLAGIDQLTTEIGNQNLSVSFPYDETAVDKVSYHIGEETQRFYLTVKPKKGAKPLDASQVTFAYTGADTDLIFLVGVSQLESLKDLYVGYEEIYETKPVVTVHSFSPDFGTLHLDTSGTPSMSEAVVPMLRDLGLALDVEVATNLLSAIEQLTKGFQSLSTTADTFETVANLLRIGARRVRAPEAQSVGTTETQLMAEKPKTEVKQKPKKSEVETQKEVKPGSLNFQPTSGIAKS